MIVTKEHRALLAAELPKFDTPERRERYLNSHVLRAGGKDAFNREYRREVLLAAYVFSDAIDPVLDAGYKHESIDTVLRRIVSKVML